MSVYQTRLHRRRAATIGETVTALTHAPYLPALADLFVPAGIGRPRLHPGWVPLAYCALARHFGSYSRLDAELSHGLWDQLTSTAVDAGLEPPGPQPFQYPQHCYWRDLVINDPDTRAELADTFTRTALADAHNRRLLIPNTGGSLTHPIRSRLIYGDGTVVRPRFRHRPNDTAHRHDPSAADHQRHDGNIYGNNFVFISSRGPAHRDRVILTVGRVPAPGGEAATAIALIEHVHRHAPPGGIQGVVYDGALQGVHIDHLMRTTGLIVINKVHAAIRRDDHVVHKRKPLGTYHHPHRRGGGACPHQLVAINGRIADVQLADDGTPTVAHYAERQQIKRSRRSDGTYRFNLGIQLPCRHAKGGHWTTWLSPHDNPENIRLIPPDDEDFPPLYGLRPDAESLNSALKRTLIIDRAPSIGWERQLYDLTGFAILNNTRTPTSASPVNSQ